MTDHFFDLGPAATLPSAGPSDAGAVCAPTAEPDAGKNHTRASVQPAPALTFTAHGTPKPKGSMRHVGHGRMVEQVNGKPWREAVKWAAIEAMRNRRTALLHPLEGPLRVEATFTFTKPASAPKRRPSWPITRSTGDADKQLRNLFDAMQDAGVIRDDSQIVEATVAKRYPLEGADALSFPGVVVRVFTITADTESA